MANSLTIRQPASGLHVQANSFADVPDGSYERAENVVFSRDGIIEKRRGYESLEALTDPEKMFSFDGDLYVIDDAKIKQIENDGTLTTIVSSASFLSFSNVSPRTVNTENAVFITSDVGILKFDGSSLSLAGLPPGLDLKIDFTSALTGPLAPDTQTQYRYTFKRNELESAPSSPGVIVNSLISASASNSGTTVTVTSVAHGLIAGTLVRVKNCNSSDVDGDYTIAVPTVDTFTFVVPSSPASSVTGLDYGIWKTPQVTVTLPTLLSGIAAGDSLRLYRSLSSAGEDIPASDELQLTTEEVITSGEITAKEKVITDSLDELFLADFLYTNANSGDGLAQANTRAPLARDLDIYKGYTFYGNTESLDTFNLNLVSVSTLANDDTIVIAGETYTFKTAGEDDANKEVFLQKTSTVSINIDTTARSLVRVINKASTKLYAYYLSGSNDIPGQILLQARDYSIGSFTTQCSAAGADFLPNITTAQSSSDTINPNYLYYSKQNDTEAVPALNFFEVGASNDPILRIVGLRDSLIIVKQDSVYKLVGETSQDFTIIKIDDTVTCVASGTVAKLNNQVFMLSNQGIVQISEGGISLTSRAIEPLLLNVVANVNITTSASVGYETDRLYLLSTIKPYGTTSDSIYAYNLITRGFSTWTFHFDDAIVHDDKMYYFVGTSLYRERKERNKLDYTNDRFAATVGELTAPNQCFMTFADENLPTTNDVLVIDDLIYRITGVDVGAGGNLITFATTVNFEETDTGYIYEGYSCELISAPITGGEIGKLKRFSEFQIHFRNLTPAELILSFKSDRFSGSTSTTWTPATVEFGWGNQAWAFFQWGEEESINLPYTTSNAEKCRIYIPRECARGTFIQHRVIHNIAAEPLLIQAFSYTAYLTNQIINR